jgi:hypothetical protein
MGRHWRMIQFTTSCAATNTRLGSGRKLDPHHLEDLKMSEKEIAQNVLILVSKGCVSDYGDTDYFYNASDDVLDRAYEMMDELQQDGAKAFKERYELE